MGAQQSDVGWDLAAEAIEWPGLPVLDGAQTADACVVGLGGSGLAAVAELVDRGLSVVGVDAGRVAAGAAGRNGGFLVAGPEEPLHTAISLWGEEAAVSLYRATLAEIDYLQALLGDDVIARSGSIRLVGIPGTPTSDDEMADRERDWADCLVQEAAMHAHGFAVERYDGPLGRGLYFPADAAMNPARRALGMAARLRSVALLYENSPVRLVEPGRVVTDRGQVQAPLVLVAVDGRLEVLLPQLASTVRTARLQMLATAPVSPGRLPCPVYGRWGYDYAQQDATGRIYVGAGRDRFEDEEWTTDAVPTEPVQDYIDVVAERMAGEPVTVTHRWAASVGFTPDGKPLCARVDDGVYAVGGYNGTGNLVGPIVARAAIAWALDGVHPPEYVLRVE